MSQPKYWKDLEQLEQTPEYLAQANKEFPTDIPLDETLSNTTEESLSVSANRRDFLKVMGFGVSAATLSACFEAPVRKAIPYVNKPQDVIPGVANWYASTTPEGIPVLVKTREGRPIKMEGNPDYPLTGGGLDAVGQASVLDVYDQDRLRGPKVGGNYSTWDGVDAEIRMKLNGIRNNGGKIRVLARTQMGETTQAIINDFLAGFADGKFVQYDPVSSYAIAKAQEMNLGRFGVPHYDFAKADVIVSFGADFLGTWISPVEFAHQYAKRRNPDRNMSRHLHFESLMSITGAKADLRFPIKPSQEGLALLNLYNKLARKLGRPTLRNVPDFNVAMNGIDVAADDLAKAQGKSLVVCGSNDIATQQLVNAINSMLGNFGKTIHPYNQNYARQGNDEELATLARELENGEVAALILVDANPVYDTPYGEVFERALGGLQLSISMASKEDESSSLCGYTCPDSHYLESWGEAALNYVHYSLVQPVINPIFDTRQTEDSFLRWSGSNQSYRDYLKEFWASHTKQGMTPEAFWTESLRQGFTDEPALAANLPETYPDPTIELGAIASQLTRQANGGGGDELVIYERVALRDGKYANNPWLQELPDPITRATWDSYVTVPKAKADEMGLKTGDVVTLGVGGQEMTLPAYVQVGQANGVLGLAVGFGRAKGGRVIDTLAEEDRVGNVSAYPLITFNNGSFQYACGGASLNKTGRTYEIARIQTFDYLYDKAKGELLGTDYDRSEQIVKTTDLAYYNDNDEHNPYRESLAKYQERKKHLVTLWDSYFEDPETRRLIHWTMAIDLNKCTGCGACVVSCHAENNVPVVGRQEVLNSREMHWLRIDRYYSGNPESPDVVFQPMLCQHCDNAPCETVCPVLATIHSNEGLNQMTYNRCVGTRYCANNCPYKVRRFNWFNYTNSDRFKEINPSQSEYGKLVLNPDVTVRFRGVMEKCSFCAQRLQEGKLRAKINSQDTFAKPKDGDIKTACQQSCPTGAIVFGDRNDPNSAVSKAMRHERSYLALEEVKTLPSVNYMTLVRNRTKSEAEFKEAERQAEQNYGQGNSQTPVAHEDNQHS